MTAIAHDTDELRELDVETRRAWSAYSERLRELTGEEYEHAERESWAELQSELRRLERRRQSLNRTASSGTRGTALCATGRCRPIAPALRWVRVRPRPPARGRVGERRTGSGCARRRSGSLALAPSRWPAAAAGRRSPTSRGRRRRSTSRSTSTTLACRCRRRPSAPGRWCSSSPTRPTKRRVAGDPAQGRHRIDRQHRADQPAGHGSGDSQPRPRRLHGRDHRPSGTTEAARAAASPVHAPRSLSARPRPSAQTSSPALPSRLKAPARRNFSECAILACMQVTAASGSDAVGIEARRRQPRAARPRSDLYALVVYLHKNCNSDLFEAVGALELTLTQIKLLHHLDDASSELTLKEAAELVHVSLPAASRHGR